MDLCSPIGMNHDFRTESGENILPTPDLILSK
jgi:hypothetical protein